MNYRNALLAGMLLLFAEAIHAEVAASTPVQPVSSPTVEAQIQELEKNIKDQQTSSKAEADLLKKQTEAETTILKGQLDQYLFFRDWEARLILAVIGFILGGSAGILWTRSKISDVVQQQSKEIEEKIKADFANEQAQLGQTLKRLVHAEAQTIENTFAKTRQEEQFKQDSHILIITGQKDSGLDKDFKQLGFNAYKLDRIQFSQTFHRNQDEENNSILIDENGYDLIVLDSLTNEDLLDYLKAGTQPAYLVYYEGGYTHYPDRQRSNIANSKLTLYSRAMEVLLYKHAQRT